MSIKCGQLLCYTHVQFRIYRLGFQTMARRFEIDGTFTRQYRRYSAIGTQLIARLLPPTSHNRDPLRHILASVNDLFEYALRDMSDSDMVGITI